MFPTVLNTRAVGAPSRQSASAGSASRSRTAPGFSILELLIVLGISITVVAIAMPFFTQGFYNIRLKSAASNLSGLMQQARIQAARQNRIYTIAYNASPPGACIDANFNQACDAGETVIRFNQSISISTTATAPSGSGAPTPYVLVGDTAGTTFTNNTILGYSARGLPCPYTTGNCPTPAAGYFVYYIQDSRVVTNGWAAVVVTRSGRSKAITWNGASWD